MQSDLIDDRVDLNSRTQETRRESILPVRLESIIDKRYSDESDRKLTYLIISDSLKRTQEDFDATRKIGVAWSPFDGVCDRLASIRETGNGVPIRTFRCGSNPRGPEAIACAGLSSRRRLRSLF